MDTTTLQLLTSVISGLPGGGAGAGTQELLERLGKLRERSGAPDTLPTSEAAVEDAARGLLAAAEEDESLRDALAHWLTDAQKRVSGGLVVNNTVSGVVIGGSVIQTGIAPKHCPPPMIGYGSPSATAPRGGGPSAASGPCSSLYGRSRPSRGCWTYCPR